MKRYAVVVLILVLAVILTGCVKGDVDLQVRKDGKIDATVFFGISESADYGGEGYVEEVLSEIEVENMQSEGWTVDPYNQDGYIGYLMTKMGIDAEEIMRLFALDENESREPLTKRGSRYILEFPIGRILYNAEASISDAIPALESLGATMKFRITLPNKPVSHNAPIVSEDGKTLEWDLLSLKEEDTAHVEFKLGSGSPIFPLIISAVVFAACLVGVMILKRRKA